MGNAFSRSAGLELSLIQCLAELTDTMLGLTLVRINNNDQRGLRTGSASPIRSDSSSISPANPLLSAAPTGW